MKIEDIGLSLSEEQELKQLLSKSKKLPHEVEDIWAIMDFVWDEIGCDNKKLDYDKIEKFYRHPVWLLNGFFIEQHDLSMQHRNAISGWLFKKNLKLVLDYGSGFGTLARLIAKKDMTISVDIYEPYPSKYVISRFKDYSNIHFVSSFDKQYDCLVGIDVLEHVPDPLKLFSKMVRLVKENGYLIIANNFYPVIKCHLPYTFHLRYTFNKFTRLMGLELIGPCEGSHATIYRKRKAVPFNWWRIRIYERVSRVLFLFLKIAHFPYRIFSKAFKKVLR